MFNYENHSLIKLHCVFQKISVSMR